MYSRGKFGLWEGFDGLYYGLWINKTINKIYQYLLKGIENGVVTK